MTEAMTELDKLWNQQYEKLVEYKRKNGDCIVPQRYEQDKSLGHWVTSQRKCHTKNKLRQDRKHLLEELKFVWKAEGVDNNERKWNQQYAKLVEYKRKHGDCIVPQRYEQDKSLGQWVTSQRHSHTKNKIRQDRKDLLEGLEFVWKSESSSNNNTFDKNWHQHYEKLLEYKRKNGHCLVPFRYEYEQDKSLGLWVYRQRHRHSNNKMRLDRKVLLDELEFVWRVDIADNNDKLWHQHYEKLLEFKRKNGDGMMPRGYAQDKVLMNWVNQQRYRNANHKIRPDRKELLDDVEFVWKSERRSSTRDDSEVSTSSVGLPNDAPEEMEPAQDHVSNRLECPPPSNIKRPRTCLAECGQMMAARTNQGDDSTVSCSSVDSDDGSDEEDPKPAMVYSGVRTCSGDPDQEVVQAQATPDNIPCGWTRTKLEPDW